MADMDRLKEMEGGKERNRLHRAMRNGAWHGTILHRPNGMDLSWEEFQDDLCLRYGLIYQEIPMTCDGCGRKFSIDHALLCPNCGLVMERYENN